MDLMPFMAQMGILSRLSTGSAAFDMALAMALPVFITWLTSMLTLLVASASRARANQGYTRRIEHCLLANQW